MRTKSFYILGLLLCLSTVASSGESAGRRRPQPLSVSTHCAAKVATSPAGGTGGTVSTANATAVENVDYTTGTFIKFMYI